MRLSNLLLLVLACGVAFAAYRTFWLPPPSSNVQFYLSAYLALTVTASLGSFLARPRWQIPFRAYALFACCHFIFVMWGGFVISFAHQSERVANGAKSGVVFGFLTAIVAFVLFNPPEGGPHR